MPRKATAWRWMPSSWNLRDGRSRHHRRPGAGCRLPRLGRAGGKGEATGGLGAEPDRWFGGGSFQRRGPGCSQYGRVLRKRATAGCGPRRKDRDPSAGELDRVCCLADGVNRGMVTPCPCREVLSYQPSRPSVFSAACTAGREATRSMKAEMFGHCFMSTPTHWPQLSTVKA